MHGTVRLCLDFYTPVNEVPLKDSFVKTLLKYLNLIFICIVLSMLFLNLTFAIFGLLQGLQTIPGKIFMCFSFLCSLCSSLLKSQISEDKVCAWIRGFTHYCWFSVLTFTIVCCFDMLLFYEIGWIF